MRVLAGTVKENAKLEVMDKHAPLPLACKMGHFEIVKLLLKKNADIAAVNHYKSSHLFLTATKGHLDIVKLLLRYPATPDTKYYCD